MVSTDESILPVQFFCGAQQKGNFKEKDEFLSFFKFAIIKRLSFYEMKRRQKSKRMSLDEKTEGRKGKRKEFESGFEGERL